jgi:hypothetical protein
MIFVNFNWHTSVLSVKFDEIFKVLLIISPSIEVGDFSVFERRFGYSPNV